MSKFICEKCGKEMNRKSESFDENPALYADSTAVSGTTTTTTLAPNESQYVVKRLIKIATFVCPDCGSEKQARDPAAD